MISPFTAEPGTHAERQNFFAWALGTLLRQRLHQMCAAPRAMSCSLPAAHPVIRFLTRLCALAVGSADRFLVCDIDEDLGQSIPNGGSNILAPLYTFFDTMLQGRLLQESKQISRPRTLVP